jgi:hypothetical protein
MPLQFREIRSTHRIHIFEVPDGGGGKITPQKPICGAKVGAMTYPLDPLDDIEDPRVCRACIRGHT